MLHLLSGACILVILPQWSTGPHQQKALWLRGATDYVGIQDRCGNQQQWFKDNITPYPVSVAQTSANFNNLLKRGNDKPSTVNGLQVQIECRLKDKSLDIHWRFTYHGKRAPLIVLRPALHSILSGQTELRLVAGSAKETIYVKTRSEVDIYDSSKDDFVIRKRPQDAAGIMSIEKRALLKLLQKYSAAPSEIDTILIQLIHKPFDRGITYTLDAWTGEVRSNTATIAGFWKKE